MPERGVGSGRVGWSTAGWILLAVVCSVRPQPCAAQNLELDLPGIEKIIFEGNEVFEDDELQRQTQLQFPSLLRPHTWLRRPRYQRNLFPKELRRIEAFYNRRGFGGAAASLDSAVVVSGSSGMVVLYVRIHEGPRTILREVRFSPQRVFSLEQLRRATPISDGDPYPFSVTQRGRVTRALRLTFQSEGYLQVSVQDSTLFTPDSTEAVLIFNLHPGPQFRVQQIDVDGQRDTREELIRRELRFKKGDVYSYAKVQESQQNLYNTSLFRRVSIREKNIDLAARTVDFDVRVIERKKAFIEGSVGFGRRDDYEARLIGRWGHRNLWGVGHSVELQGTAAYNLEKGSDNYYLDARLRYVHPHLFGTNTRLMPQVAASRDKRSDDVELEKFQVETQLFRKAGRYTTLGMGLSAGFTTTTLEEVTDDLLQTRSVSFTLTRNSSDNLFDPKRGEIRSISLQRAGFGGDNHFSRITGNYTRYIPFGGVVLAMGVRTGWVESFGSSRDESSTGIGIRGVPFEFLFQAGGNTTVRGFDNNSLGAPIITTTLRDETSSAVVDTFEVRAGTVLLIGNVELRMPVPVLTRFLRLRAVAFLDAGNVWNDLEEMKASRFRIRYNEPYSDLADMRYSYGLGLRYPTPFGPVRFDVGFSLKKSSRREIHLGLGHTF